MTTPAERTIDVRRFLDEQPISGFQWLIFALCFAIVLLDGFDTAAIGYIAPSLLGEWNIAKADLAPVLSAALFGLAGGALCSGPLADRFGRKLVLLVAAGVMGVASLVAATAGSLDALVIWRFVTGLGLGAAMPNAVTLVSEYCPAKRRALVTNAMFCGFPLGAAVGGFVAAWMIPHFGWRSVLELGGVAPLLLVVVMIVLLPESVRHLAQHGAPAEKIGRILQRISAAAKGATRFVLNEGEGAAEAGRRGITVVFSAPYILGTLCLWLAYFMGLVIFYGLINWMPIILRDSGISPTQATLISALFPLGGLGAILAGWLMDRFHADLVVAAGFLLTALAVYAIGQVVGQVGPLTAAVFIAGTVMNTAQSSLPALAAMFYPTRGRATGVAWMLGIGRFGGIAGSFLVAELGRRQLGTAAVFLVMAIPALIATLAILTKAWLGPKPDASAGPVPSLGH
ncbi:MFS transporter [Xanthobacter autotrophicus]|uniref:MFS transporter n=1 Tax=Xanthobacter autotrophicus TaxID=280 RepID=UPI003727CCFC